MGDHDDGELASILFLFSCDFVDGSLDFTFTFGVES
jgi:hypothetical protein